MDLGKLLRQFEMGFCTAKTNLNKTVRIGIANDHFDDFLAKYGREFGLLDQSGDAYQIRWMSDRKSKAYYAGHIIAYLRHPIKFLYLFKKAIESEKQNLE